VRVVSDTRILVRLTAAVPIEDVIEVVSRFDCVWTEEHCASFEDTKGGGATLTKMLLRVY